jgi:hypothetical protein
MLTCGFVRSNFFFAIAVRAPWLHVAAPVPFGTVPDLCPC